MCSIPIGRYVHSFGSSNINTLRLAGRLYLRYMSP